MNDQKILAAAIQSRPAYERIFSHATSREFTPPVAFWFANLVDYYQRDKSAVAADIDTLREIGRPRIPSAKLLDTYMGVLDSCSLDCSVPNIVAAFLDLRRDNAAAEFADATRKGDRKQAAALLSIVNDLAERETLDDEPEERQEAVAVEQLFEKVGTANRIPLSPRCINARIGGGVLSGHHILVFGRTEVGKSTFVINLAAGFLQQKKRVLYIGNEDEINNLKLRMLCRVTGKTASECEADQSGAFDLFRRRGGESLLRMVHLNPGSIEAISKELATAPADVLIVDQIRNLAGEEDGMTRKMEANAIRLRALIAKHSLIGVSVTQAGDRSDKHNADSPVWLSTGDVDSSRVGLPGQVDLMLGIGGNADMIARGQRAISLCKNKLFSGENAREGLIVNFDLQRSIVS